MTTTTQARPRFAALDRLRKLTDFLGRCPQRRLPNDVAEMIDFFWSFSLKVIADAKRGAISEAKYREAAPHMCDAAELLYRAAVEAVFDV